MITLNDKNFEKNVLKSKIPVFVDFWASWCGPCQIMGPIFEELDKKFGNNILFGKVNVDENHILSSEYKIEAIPTIIIFKNGKLIDKIIGVSSKEKIEEKIKKLT